MEKKEKIERVLSAKSIAVSGVSRDKNKFSRKVYEGFCKRGYKVYPINPKLAAIDGNIVYPNIQSISDNFDALVMLNTGEKSVSIVKEAIEKGVGNFWIQQSCGTPELESLLMEKGLNYVTGECIFMWMNPVTGIHKFHRFLRNLFSRE